MDILAERALKNEAARYKGLGARGPLKPYIKREASIFGRSLSKGFRHPLDKVFRCGFDPQGVTIKQYRVHISNCEHAECIDRHMGWLELMEYFRKRL